MRDGTQPFDSIAGRLESKNHVEMQPWMLEITGLPDFLYWITSDLKLDWGVCTSLTQLYDGRDMYKIYYIKNNYMFRPFTLAIFRLRNEKT